MRITTFDLVGRKRCGIEAPLRRLAASASPLQAASWKKVLELVEHLQSSGSEPELRGQILSQDLLLRKAEPPDPVRERELTKFLDEWRARNPDPAAWRDCFQEIRRRFPPVPGVRVFVRVDWRDYAPLRDGLPEMHYRFQMIRPGTILSEGARAKDPVEAERILRAAFGC